MISIMDAITNDLRSCIYIEIHRCIYATVQEQFIDDILCHWSDDRMCYITPSYCANYRDLSQGAIYFCIYSSRVISGVMFSYRQLLPHGYVYSRDGLKGAIDDAIRKDRLRLLYARIE